MFLLPFVGISQEAKVRNWLMYFGTNIISNNFSIHTTIPFRNHTIIPNNIEQWLLRTGLNYHFSENAFATTGHAYIVMYDSDYKLYRVIQLIMG